MSRSAARLKVTSSPPSRMLPGGRQLEPGDHAERRRLAAAGRPEHDEELAVGDGEVRILHRDEVGEGLAQVLDADLGHRRITPGNG